MNERPPWIIFENTVYRWLSIGSYTSGIPDVGGPTIKSREQLDALIAELQEAGERVFG